MRRLGIEAAGMALALGLASGCLNDDKAATADVVEGLDAAEVEVAGADVVAEPDVTTGPDVVGEPDVAAPSDVGPADVGPADVGPADVGPADGGFDAQPDGAPDVGLPEGALKTGMGGWTMAPGAETTRCVLKRLDNDTPVLVRSIETTLSKGSHHLIVYRTDETMEKPNAYPCSPFAGTLSGGAAPLMISQIPSETLTLPDGVAFEFGPKQMIRLEAHYANYYPEEIAPEVDVVFQTAPDDGTLERADFLFYGSSKISLPAGQETTGPWSWYDVPDGSKVFALTAHTHKLGLNVEVEKTLGVGQPGTALYPDPEGAAFDWAEPPVVAFTPHETFGPGEGLRLRCTWFNDTGGKVGFGESANSEMCFTWAYYYPSKGYRVCIEPFASCPGDP